MSNWQAHPEAVALVRLVDGELSAAEAREVELHLAACPACRAEVDGLRATVIDCLRYRSEVLQPLLPPPPEPWADLRPEFERVDRALADVAGRPRWWRAPVLRWGLAAAAAVALTFGIFHQLRETPSVEAATLLRKAEAAAAVRPVARHRVLIRTKTLQYTRLAGVAGALPREPAPPALEALFRDAHWDWNDPLSARAFEAWRDPLIEKKDTITPTADTVEIRTLTAEGPLAAASLTLRTGDLEPIAGRLEFRNQDWVEMSEVADTAPQGEGTVAAPPPAPAPSAAPAEATPPAGSISETGLLSSELHVLLKLHEIKADLGDPVEVTIASGRVLVMGHAGIAPERQRQIQTAMEGVPNVAVQFSEAAQAPPGAEPAAAPAATAPSASSIATRVERQLGGRPQFERFSSQMLDWTEAAMAQTYALRSLADHFPPAREALLNVADRRALRAAAREQVAALDSVAGRISRTLDPLLTALGGESSGGGPAADTWQPAAEELLQTARRFDRNLSMLLGAAPADTAFSPTELRSALGRLVDETARCQRLLGQ